VVFEIAWGDVQVRVSLTAQLMQALYQIDTWPRRSRFGRSGMPSEEEAIVRDRLLVEEATLIGPSKTGSEPVSKRRLDEVHPLVIAAVYDDAMPTDEAAG